MTNTKETDNFKQVDLDSDHNASWARVEQLKAGRREEDIHTSDEYWKALSKHRQAFQKGTLK